MIHSNTTKKAAGASNTSGLHRDTNGANFLTDVAFQQAPGGNAIASQIARLALTGHTGHKGGTGNFLAGKYGLSRYCKGFAKLEAYAQQAEGM
ncbi:MAG: hypothetical protein A3J24_02970 [Deltaproteobacteria bacterium RIFCSPLOWO2_02_FULL_53_8]|nr:MAG: hypothetical protein A3J24_02970 [Deltaproteobacteria bacterium RIFCSPLOWO2_02_FULL_53_8]